MTQFLDASFDPYSRYENTRFDSVSSEAIYQVLNPVTDPVGLALYIEPDIGSKEKELEWRVILQKNFLEDRLIAAINIMAKHEREADGSIERASPIDVTFGMSYLVIPNWMIGFETRVHNEFTGYGSTIPNIPRSLPAPSSTTPLRPEGIMMDAGLASPTADVITYNEDQASVVKHGRIYGDEHARDEVMFRLCVPFAVK
ncbi:hypothetical protein QA641_06430 [Bradyrhizobium sp. CB1650]|uniref:hypothetical protein n=1 Tax=Bradyrhizobium sp. CB1650 TaxID=3039153 RepID=UPI00243486C2|nr:hypothetical protein [Bradyrhizobium sp. CB1650]WGD53547.1 hypothetical protein QA641_06430 [Bradyrhizobium sp. CB1650]